MFKFRYFGQKPIFQSPRLTIRAAAIREVMPPCFVQRPGGTGDFLFMIFHDTVRLGEDGSGTAFPGSMVLWNRTAPHFYGNPLLRWSHSWVHCDGSAVRAAWRAAAVPCGKPILVCHLSRAEEYLFAIHEEVSGPTPPDELILRNTLANLIQEAARSQNATPKPLVPQTFLAAREQIDTEYDQRITLADLSAHAGISLAHFCTEFRRHFGVPPIAYLVQRRMRAATALLQETELPVGEIGRRVGYDDPYYFSKHFKACLGVPPSHYAKRRITPREPGLPPG